MIVADRFVFLHLHKSGGSFVNEFLLRFVPDARRLGYHLPRSLTPATHASLPTLGFVRNPWSYYLSWYSFQSQLPYPNPLFKVLSEEGTLGFDATLRRMLQLGVDDELLDQVISVLPPVYSNQGLNLPGPALAEIRHSGSGFYSFLYRYLYAGSGGPLHVGRMEHLRADLPSMLRLIGQPLSEAAHRHVAIGEPRNVSVHAPYTHYYDESLSCLVADRDADLIARHGYSFAI